MMMKLICFVGCVLAGFVCKELFFRRATINTNELQTKPELESFVVNNWPLLPPQDSILLIDDEDELQKAIHLAKNGDMDAMLGLISWHNRIDDALGASYWINQLDTMRASKGLKPYIDSLPRPPPP